MRLVSRAVALGVGALIGIGCVSVNFATAPPTSQPQQTPPLFGGLTPAPPSLPALPTFELPTLPPLPTFELPTIDLPTFPRASSPPASVPATPLGEPTVSVVIGDRAHEAFGTPNCNYGLLDADTWGIEYGDMNAAPDQVSSVRIIDAPDTTAPGERIVSVVIMVGNILSGGATYILQGDRFSQPPLEYELVEAADGSLTANLRGASMASPLSPEVKVIAVRVRCPSVQR